MNLERIVSLVLVCMGIGVGSTLKALGAQAIEPTSLKVIWIASGGLKELKSWSIQDISTLKKVTTREKDPASKRWAKWEGVLLSQWIDRVLEDLPLENRAQVDLIILKGSQGEIAPIPRALVGKYPLMLATHGEIEGGGTIETLERGPFYSVVPWSSKPRILNEELPIENYSMSRIRQVELTNYRDRYSSLFLKRRTDPSAMRGEKLFVQNCVGCHTMNQGPVIGSIAEETRSKKFAQGDHPPLKSSMRLSERDRRSIARYLEAHRSENPTSVGHIVKSVQAAPNQSK